MWFDTVCSMDIVFGRVHGDFDFILNSYLLFKFIDPLFSYNPK